MENKTNIMHSKLLLEHGLINYISGSDYDLSYKKSGDKVKDYVDKILKTMGTETREIYSAIQTHTNIIKYCDGENGQDFIYGKNFDQTDGLITDKKKIALLIKFADCTPIVLYDPIKKVQASLHSGWRGTVKEISANAIEMMQDKFSCKKENILAYLGPSIDVKNYEVGKEVYDKFSNFKNRDSFFKAHGDKYLLSMIDANLDILLRYGILEKNIEISNLSTFDRKDLNSARRDGVNYKLNSIITIME